MDQGLRRDDMLKPLAHHGTPLLLYAGEKVVLNIISKINSLQKIISQNRSVGIHNAPSRFMEL
jgi:hypothetical protein